MTAGQQAEELGDLVAGVERAADLVDDQHVHGLEMLDHEGFRLGGVSPVGRLDAAEHVDDGRVVGRAALLHDVLGDADRHVRLAGAGCPEQRDAAPGLQRQLERADVLAHPVPHAALLVHAVLPVPDRAGSEPLGDVGSDQLGGVHALLLGQAVGLLLCLELPLGVALGAVGPERFVPRVAVLHAPRRVVGMGLVELALCGALVAASPVVAPAWGLLFVSHLVRLPTRIRFRVHGRSPGCRCCRPTGSQSPCRFWRGPTVTAPRSRLPSAGP